MLWEWWTGHLCSGWCCWCWCWCWWCFVPIHKTEYISLCVFRWERLHNGQCVSHRLKNTLHLACTEMNNDVSDLWQASASILFNRDFSMDAKQFKMMQRCLLSLLKLICAMHASICYFRFIFDPILHETNLAA